MHGVAHFLKVPSWSNTEGSPRGTQRPLSIVESPSSAMCVFDRRPPLRFPMAKTPEWQTAWPKCHFGQLQFLRKATDSVNECELSIFFMAKTCKAMQSRHQTCLDPFGLTTDLWSGRNILCNRTVTVSTCPESFWTAQTKLWCPYSRQPASVQEPDGWETGGPSKVRNHDLRTEKYRKKNMNNCIPLDLLVTSMYLNYTRKSCTKKAWDAKSSFTWVLSAKVSGCLSLENLGKRIHRTAIAASFGWATQKAFSHWLDMRSPAASVHLSDTDICLKGLNRATQNRKVGFHQLGRPLRHPLAWVAICMMFVLLMPLKHSQ